MKKIFVVLLVGMILFSLAGCSGKTNSADGQAAWTISIEGVEKEAISFTNQEAEKIGMVTQKAAMKDKNSSMPVQEWVGVSLAKVLEHYGVKSYTTVKVEAADGHAKEYTPDLIATSGALLGVKVDGKELSEENGPVQLVVDGKGSNWWINKVAKITVIK